MQASKPPNSRAHESGLDWSHLSDDQSDALLDATTFTNKLGCRTDMLPAGCNAHRIFFVTVDGVPMYPGFYVDPRFDRKRLEAITKLLGNLAGGSKWQFFIRAKGSLGSVTPLQALLANRYAAVRVSAQGFVSR